MSHLTNYGAALVEALAATVLVAVAGAVVAAAATTSLRAVRRAGAIERLTTVAARELAAAQATGALPGADDATLAEPGFALPLSRRTLVTRRNNGIVELAVSVHAEPDGDTVGLTTRMLVSP